MEYSRYEKLHFFKVLLDRTDDQSKPNFFYDELIDAVRTGKMSGQRAHLLFNSFKADEYIHDEDDPSNQGNKLYLISDAGREYYKYLVDEAEEEKLDDKIKSLTISSTNFSRRVAFVSLLVAGLAAFVPLIIWFIDKDEVKKTKTEIPQLEKVMQSQEQLQQKVQEIQSLLQKQDTSVKKIRVVKK